MRVLTYRHLDPRHVQAQYDRVLHALQTGDFKTADVKKLTGHPYWRAKLDDTNRLLLSFQHYQGETVCLVLEVIPFHRYEKSRFLRGAAVQDHHIDQAPLSTTSDVQAAATPLGYLHPTEPTFHVLDKVISFDDAQAQIYQTPLPLMLIGAAGSGKTALTLEKLRTLSGQVLYVTLSPYLARQAQALYERSDPPHAQETAFLSLAELIETVRVPSGQELTFAAFRTWVQQQGPATRFTDAPTLYEEFRGVLGSPATGPLDQAQYLTLGVRQSLFPPAERPQVHALFLKYTRWLTDTGRYDPNLLAFSCLPDVPQAYDAVVVDEVQDMTPVQLALALASLRDDQQAQFMLCGDSHQIVHPNFFSWAAVREVFHTQGLDVPISILQSNFRNAGTITHTANRVLQIKQARFGSVDRESTALAQPMNTQPGSVEFLPATPKALTALNQAIRQNARFAVLVLRDEDKPKAQQVFQTPLIFSVQEAKGLEYDGIVTFNFISDHRPAYATLAGDLIPADLQTELHFARARDKQDKALERHKFEVNALYVALTRAARQVVMVEHDTQHPLLGLLGVQQAGEQVTTPQHTSSREEWTAEAQRLVAQGKTEQAQAITDRILNFKPVPWEVLDGSALQQLVNKTYDQPLSSKELRTAFEQAVWHQHLHFIDSLGDKEQYGPARTLQTAQQRVQRLNQLRQDELKEYGRKNTKWIHHSCDLYGVEFRNRFGATPLMLAALSGNVPLIKELLARGASPAGTDFFHFTPVLHAINRALRDPTFTTFPEVYDLLVPAYLDVLVDDRLQRLHRRQPEFGVLLRALAALKGLTYHKDQPVIGLTARDLQWALPIPQEANPELQLTSPHLSNVLARAERDSRYQPARKLFLRVKYGRYLPNPALQVRTVSPNGEAWTRLAQAFNVQYLGLPEDIYRELQGVTICSFPEPRVLGTPLHRVTGSYNTSGLLSTFWYRYDFSLDMFGLYSRLLTPGPHFLRADDPICHTDEMTPGQVLHLLQQMIAVRSVLVTQEGEIGLIYDTGEDVLVNGPTRQLSDEALHLLLAWQQFRQPDTLNPDAMQDLRQAGYTAIAEELKQGVQAVPAHLWNPDPLPASDLTEV